MTATAHTTETGTQRAAQRRRTYNERLADEIMAALDRTDRLLALVVEVLNRNTTGGGKA